ncbi:MAG TPA: ferredoxin [Thermoleophilaceae bacterium]|nr:ferredoxin [Thermoleophilaceae bacterium]
MRITVDRDICDLHGQCVLTAPDIFRFDDDGELQYLPEVDGGLAAAAESAASVCPTGAIEIEP